MNKTTPGLAGAVLGAAIGAGIGIVATPILWYLFCAEAILQVMDGGLDSKAADRFLSAAAIPGMTLIFFTCGGVGALIGRWLQARSTNPNEPAVLKASGAVLLGFLGILAGGALGGIVGFYTYMVGIMAGQNWSALVFLFCAVGALLGIAAGLLLTRWIALRRAGAAISPPTQ